MRKLACIAGFVLVALLGACSTINEQERKQQVDETVKKVAGEVFNGKTNFTFDIEAPPNLIPLIREQTYLGRWQRRKDYDVDQFSGLVARLKSEVQLILQSQGYFNGSSETTEDGGGVRLVVSAGPRTTVNKVDLTVRGPDEGLEKVKAFALARWRLPEGAFFDSGLWQSSKRAIVETLNQEGYLRARIVKSQASINRPLTAASVVLIIDSGPRITFGDVRITGLKRYDDHVIRNLKGFKKGDPYTLDALVNFQNRVRAAGYFSDVSITPVLEEFENDPTAESVDLAVKVTELQSKRLVVGLGYSTDEGVRGQLGLEHRDVFGKSWQMQSALVASNTVRRGFVNLRSPLSDTNHFWGVGGRLERENVAGQITNASNTYFGRGRRLGEIEWFTSLQYQVERQRLVPSGQSTSQRALVLGYSWNLRRLDSAIDPSRGYTISAQLSGARKGLATDETFIRIHTRAMRFFPLPAGSLWRNGRFVALAEVGVVNTSDPRAIPTENLFRTGGARTVRGYSYLSLGVDEAGSVIGGRYLAVGSLEYQHRMSDLYSLAAFVDVGDAADESSGLSLKFGYGLGVRVRTPVGPINLDVAYGRAIHRWRAHFSVGYSF
ncbi:MAG: BamA/TamA family outer membrane protein [Burkholderiaceae bacterium]